MTVNIYIDCDVLIYCLFVVFYYPVNLRRTVESSVQKELLEIIRIPRLLLLISLIAPVPAENSTGMLILL